MEHKNRKHSLLTIGIISIASPLPMNIITPLWAWIFSIVFGTGLLGYTTTPDWITYSGFIPLLFSPAFNIFGIIFGLIRRKEKHSVLCIVLSIAGLLLNVALFFGMGYIDPEF